MSTPAVFYYDFNSPYAYLAAERIHRLIPDAEWRPIAFAILHGQLGRLESRLEDLDPAPIAAEVAVRAAERGLPPFAPPKAWPVETWSLTPLRAALFADERGRLREFSAAAYRTSFVESRSLAELDNVLRAARKAGLEPDAVREAIARPEIKERLKSYTAEALARGVTGIPTVVVTSCSGATTASRKLRLPPATRRRGRRNCRDFQRPSARVFARAVAALATKQLPIARALLPLIAHCGSGPGVWPRSRWSSL